jgi:ATP-dependent DNA ligase
MQERTVSQPTRITFACLRRLDNVFGKDLFEHACKLGCEGIVSKRLGSPYRSGRSPHWLKIKNPRAPAARREAEEDW